VAKQRIVNTKFWDDSYIAGLSPLEKLIFLYLITNPLTNISGVYELPLKRAAFDVGLEVEAIAAILKRFEADGKLLRLAGWLAVKNFIKYQTLNPKIRVGIANELRHAPKALTDRLCIDYQSLSIPFDSPAHSNSNPNSNPNSNGLPFGKFSTAGAEEIRRGTEALARKFRVDG